MLKGDCNLNSVFPSFAKRLKQDYVHRKKVFLERKCLHVDVSSCSRGGQSDSGCGFLCHQLTTGTLQQTCSGLLGGHASLFPEFALWWQTDMQACQTSLRPVACCVWGLQPLWEGPKLFDFWPLWRWNPFFKLDKQFYSDSCPLFTSSFIWLSAAWKSSILLDFFY